MYLSSSKKNMIDLFYPNVNTKECLKELKGTLSSKWIGGGLKVELFEKRFAEYIKSPYAVAVCSGTAALHLAYALSGIKKGDEVITPVFTCAATNIPLLYLGAIPVFADIKDDMTIDPEDVKKKITKKTKAIIAVDMGGNRSDYKSLKKFGLPIIADMAQSLFYNPEAQYSCYSFQAIKFMTTGDGGAIVMKNKKDYKRAKMLSWYGIDKEKAGRDKYNREINFLGVTEIGFKYRMNAIAASLGLVGLKYVHKDLEHRNKLVKLYNELLKDIEGVDVIDNSDSSKWLYMIKIKNRKKFFKDMYEAGIEVHMSHVRNDNMIIFKPYKNHCPNMDRIENHYICLPLNITVSEKDIGYICDTIKKNI